MAKETQEGLTATREGNFSEWFAQLIKKAELADYSSVSGCVVFRPKSYQIWEKLKSAIDKEFKKMGIQNSYFPLFIPEKLLAKESKHVEGFTPEVAWVTHAGKTKLKEKLAVRPTSEAIMYDSYSKWIRSHNDLPLKLNQWNNVVRWEFKHPVPFLRTREFLWNEGHNVYSNAKDVEKDRKAVMKIYHDFMKDYMALPSLPGKKSDKEKFAGAEATYSFELMLPNGKAIQGPDYHDDGQNFSKAYDISFLDEKGQRQFAFQSTYAITTRMLGVMFAIHSDNNGLVIPPKLAENKVVIVPILFDKTKSKVLAEAKEIKKSLARFNPILDIREDVSPGWKYNEWELKGIPIRIEVGPKDIASKTVTIAKRTSTGNKKFSVKISQLEKQIPSLLDEIQDELYKKAEKLLKSSMASAKSMNDVVKAVKNKKIVLAPVCGSSACEDIIKHKTGGAKTLNAPLNQKPFSLKAKKCIACSKKAAYQIYIGKSY